MKYMMAIIMGFSCALPMQASDWAKCIGAGCVGGLAVYAATRYSAKPQDTAALDAAARIEFAQKQGAEIVTIREGLARLQTLNFEQGLELGKQRGAILALQRQVATSGSQKKLVLSSADVASSELQFSDSDEEGKKSPLRDECIASSGLRVMKSHTSRVSVAQAPLSVLVAAAASAKPLAEQSFCDRSPERSSGVLGKANTIQ